MRHAAHVELAPSFLSVILAQAAWARSVHTFLARRRRATKRGCKLEIEFATELEAEEFQRLLLRQGRRG